MPVKYFCDRCEFLVDNEKVKGIYLHIVSETKGEYLKYQQVCPECLEIIKRYWEDLKLFGEQ